MKRFFPLLFFIPVLIGFSLLQKFYQGNNGQEASPESANKNFSDPQENKEPSFIDSLRERSYGDGEFKIENEIERNGSYSGYLFSYSSDGLKIYGRMNIPFGESPAGGFPVIILNHGYFNNTSFKSGDGTQTMADIMARNGYLTLASDYRGHGNSEDDGRVSRGHRRICH
ncbi:MAG: dipeptidyl peptidase IV-related protein [Candidatus Gottesmanbacteria bacterium GW2011_GWA2_43_14]|uniref:Dipeptidyl peptidase IV-related protein n=1 Tax=Candidatus Gottesmanbacteria bacterium GW2011_GWA2_43_14 TaxID=1618443 RepID=A0A0G1FSK8_9BACT|nr:MAG: dipeptidyl peptidase IV-related protein [Candidatus Gottesmanbacteria bacterium GW2011_GWA2_43_14]